jgi:ABC-type protease/lipase transport system fused ATPase/permease subunit
MARSDNATTPCRHQEHGITHVTISHRPALLAYHDQLLAIGDGAAWARAVKLLSRALFVLYG